MKIPRGIDELCEGCGDPAALWDSEGVPLCAECAKLDRPSGCLTAVVVITLAPVIFLALYLACIWLGWIVE